MKYVCVCGYEYDPAVGDPDGGIAPGTPFEDIPDDWVCPVCGLGKDAFSPRHLDYLMDYAKAHNFRVCGNARGNLVCSVVEDGTLTGYFEVWVPVCD